MDWTEPPWVIVDVTFWLIDKNYKWLSVSLCLQIVDTDEKGHIVVDEFQNTSRAGIYAVGDVCGKALLTPGTKLHE